MWPPIKASLLVLGTRRAGESSPPSKTLPYYYRWLVHVLVRQFWYVWNTGIALVDGGTRMLARSVTALPALFSRVATASIRTLALLWPGGGETTPRPRRRRPPPPSPRTLPAISLSSRDDALRRRPRPPPTAAP